jgi:hypothetical protein
MTSPLVRSKRPMVGLLSPRLWNQLSKWSWCPVAYVPPSLSAVILQNPNT